MNTNRGSNRLRQIAEEEIEAVIEHLPVALKAETKNIAIVLEERPSEYIQEDGIEVDTLGLFVGAEYAETCGIMPAQIILFVENIWAFAEGCEAKYREELRKTFLHELGHFLGLDEDDLSRRGLD